MSIKVEYEYTTSEENITVINEKDQYLTITGPFSDLLAHANKINRGNKLAIVSATPQLCDEYTKMYQRGIFSKYPRKGE